MSDQRTQPRQGAAARAQVWVAGSDEPIDAWVKNVSASGALLQAAPIDIGTEVRVVFGTGPQAREVEATVVRQVQDMTGYQSGVPGVAIEFKTPFKA